MSNKTDSLDNSGVTIAIQPWPVTRNRS